MQYVPKSHPKIEIHLIHNFPPSCLNRDETGMPKECVFGGVRRARVSSQCLKRWMRRRFEEAGLDVATRTWEIKAMLSERLKSGTLGLSPEQSAKLESGADKLPEVLGVFVSLYYSGMNKNRPNETTTGAFVGGAEVDTAALCVLDTWDVLCQEVERREEEARQKAEDAAANKKPARSQSKKDKKGLQADPAIQKRLSGVRYAVDLALFGRMLAEHPTRNVDGCCQVAHAISTHRVNPEFDYYTAVDDRKQRRLHATMIGGTQPQQADVDFFAGADDFSSNAGGDEDETALDADAVDMDGADEGEIALDEPETDGGTGPGAGMLGLIGYNSACYYRYLALDCQQLANNLQDTSLTREGLGQLIEEFLRASIETIPEAKRNSMAQWTPPDFGLIVVRDGGLPCSLANAFAAPIHVPTEPERNGDLIGQSVERLVGYWDRHATVYGDAGVLGTPFFCTTSDDRLEKSKLKESRKESLQQVLDEVTRLSDGFLQRIIDSRLSDTSNGSAA